MGDHELWFVRTDTCYEGGLLRSWCWESQVMWLPPLKSRPRNMRRLLLPKPCFFQKKNKTLVVQCTRTRVNGVFPTAPWQQSDILSILSYQAYHFFQEWQCAVDEEKEALRLNLRCSRKFSPICQQNSDASQDALKFVPDFKAMMHSFQMMYDILLVKVDRLAGKSI